MADKAGQNEGSAAAARVGKDSGLSLGDFYQSQTAGPTLQAGTILAGRYEILQQLGQGGMGAVYKALDMELDRLVAIKLIRPELASDAAALQRFKQELILARQITHRNVVRIYDLGEAEGVKFLTMEYVEGQDLGSILKQGQKLSVAEAVEIIRQAGAGLVAAHAEGVIHRDLKPGNIMRDGHGRVVVMDFGLARSLDTGGMTQSGALVGTLEYMSPEQAKAEPVDARSDLYALGLIFYEMLVGNVPFQTESVIASLLKRSRERAQPPSSVDSNIPKRLSDIICKCLEPKPADRYQNCSELLEALQNWDGRQPTVQIAMPRIAGLRIWYVAAAIAVVAVLAGALLVRRMQRTPVTHAPVTALVADFQNSTSDAVFDGTLEPTFSLALEGASFVTTYNRGQARRVAAQLRSGATSLDEAAARLVAVREGIAVVIAGTIERRGEQYHITAKLIDSVSGKTLSTAESDSDKAGALQAMNSLAARIRKALGDTTPESAQVANAETYTAASLEAAHEYAVAQELRYAGKGDEAIRSFLRAIDRDPNFGTAYAGLAAMYANQGKREEAVKYYKLAMARIDRMTERERFRTRGGYYLAALAPNKAVEEFTALLRQYPADTMGHSALAFAFYLQRDMNKALEEGRKALEIYPKYVPYRNNVALYALYAGEFETAAREGRAALELNPAYVKAYVTVALAELARGDVAKTKEVYGQLEKVSALGASFAASGMADLALYEGRTTDAVSILQTAIATNLKDNNASAAAKKQFMYAEAQAMRGERAAAKETLKRALATSRESVLFPAGRLFAQLGDHAQAQAIAKELGQKIESLPQAFAQIVQANVALESGNARESVRLLLEAKKLSDNWIGRFDLARAYLQAGAFAEADSELEICFKRRGEATDVFLDEVETYHYYPPVLYYRGRVHDGLKSPGAGEAYRAFLALKAPAGVQDTLVDDARRRAGATP